MGVRAAACVAAILFVAIPISTTQTAPFTSASPEPDDPFLWLEEIEGERALEWVRTQNDRTLAQLTKDPRYDRYYRAALAIAEDKSRIPTGELREGWVYNFWQDERYVRGLWRRTRLNSYRTAAPDWGNLLDLDALAGAEHRNWVFKGATCPPSKVRRCIVALSDGGKDASVLREFDIESRTFVKGGFVVPEAKTAVVWKDEDTLLVATNWGLGTLTRSGYPFIVKAWSRGEPLSSALEIHRGRAEEMGAWPQAVDGDSGTQLLVVKQAHTIFTAEYWLVDGSALTPALSRKRERVKVFSPSPLWGEGWGEGNRERVEAGVDHLTRLTLPAKAKLWCVHRGELTFTIAEDWTVGGTSWKSGALLSMPVEELARVAPRVHPVMIPGPRESVVDVAGTSSGVLVATAFNVRGRLARFTFDGTQWRGEPIQLPDNGVIGLAMTDSSANTAFVTYEDFLQPTTLYEIDVSARRAASSKALPEQVDGSRFVVEQFEASSRDGTQVPYFVVRPKVFEANGQAPTLLHAYGGFGLSILPFYSPTIGQLWLDQGGVFVLANIRGGGEFGPAWHEAGVKTHRQVVYDDFIAVAEDLIRRRITSPRRLGITGYSNGGLLMGVMVAQRPALFGAVVLEFPLLDMLRYHQLLAGASWIDEYGSPDIPEERAWLERLSPYHNLTKRPDFPVPLFVTSTQDDRVHPGHARKFAARMESLGMPYFYYENTEGGHVTAANLRESATRDALEFTYLAQRLRD